MLVIMWTHIFISPFSNFYSVTPMSQRIFFIHPFSKILFEAILPYCLMLTLRVNKGLDSTFHLLLLFLRIFSNVWYNLATNTLNENQKSRTMQTDFSESVMRTRVGYIDTPPAPISEKRSPHGLQQSILFALASTAGSGRAVARCGLRDWTITSKSRMGNKKFVFWGNFGGHSENNAMNKCND
jgi:hypothetical protein